MKMVTRASVLGGLLAAVASGLRVERQALSNGWISTTRTTGEVHFTVAVAQQNIDKVKSVALSVSDPNSLEYTNYLTGKEIEAMTAPTAKDLASVTGWLRTSGANYTATSGYLIDVVAPVAVAEKLLNTSWFRLENEETKQTVHRAAGYTIPDHLATSIDALFEVTGLPLPPSANAAISSVTAAPGTPAKVTPQVIATKYRVGGVTPSGSTTNVQAVAEFQGQFMIPANLVTFFAQFVPSAPAGSDVVYKFEGDNNGPNEGIEADLDIQYIMGVAPGIKTEFWEQKNSDFCKDLIAWTNLLTQPGTPGVNSISYGWQGDMAQIGCQSAEWNTVDQNFAKLAAMGVSIIFASGDSGSGYQAGKLWPSWPASSAWVTSVGGTRFTNQDPTQPEMATDQFGSGGGFSSMVDRSDATWQEADVSSYLSTATGLPPSTMFTKSGRATPDVSGLAEGYQVVTTGGHVMSVGGTSASTPMFAGLVALLNEARAAKGMKPMGFLNPFIYQNKMAFTDVTTGSNKIGRGGQPLAYGFEAQVGWDPATGLGTPIFPALLAAATGGGPTPPGPTPPGPPPPPGPPGPTPPGCGGSPGNRSDCGFNVPHDACIAKGCCYDDSVPGTFFCFTKQLCAVDPASRVDCGYGLSKDACLAKKCCFDDSVPFTYQCFLDSSTPTPPSPPGPAPPPPSPPSPPPPPPSPPGQTHYGNPEHGCLPDEKKVQINGVTGAYCAPHCSSSSPCPAVPAGTTATPQCIVQDPNPPPTLCAVICVPGPGAQFLPVGGGGCMPGSSCQAIQGTGVCTYPGTAGDAEGVATTGANLDLTAQ